MFLSLFALLFSAFDGVVMAQVATARLKHVECLVSLAEGHRIFKSFPEVRFVRIVSKRVACERPLPLLSWPSPRRRRC